MASPAPVRSIQRIRTFKDDVARAQQRTAPTPNPAPAAPSAAPAHVPPVAPRVVHSVPTRSQQTVTHAPIPPKPRPSPSPMPPTVSPQTEKQVGVPAPKIVPPEPASPAGRVTSPKDASRLSTDEIAADLAKIKTEKKKSVLASEESIFSVRAMSDTVDEGTIVTDTKRKRFKLLPALRDSLETWFSEKKHDYREAKKPKHTVTSAESRKDVVARAAITRTMAPKDDHLKTTERLRHVPRAHTAKGIAIKPAAEAPRPSWSHTVDTPEKAIAALEVEATIASGGVSITPQKPITPAAQPAFEPIASTLKSSPLTPSSSPQPPAKLEPLPATPATDAKPIGVSVPTPPPVEPHPPARTAPPIQPEPRSIPVTRTEPSPTPTRPLPVPERAPAPAAPRPVLPTTNPTTSTAAKSPRLPVPSRPQTVPRPVQQPAPVRTAVSQSSVLPQKAPTRIPLAPVSQPEQQPVPQAPRTIRNVSRPRFAIPLIAASVFAVMLGIGVTYTVFMSREPSTVTTDQPQGILSGAGMVPVAAGSTGDELLRNLLAGAETSASASTIELYPTVSAGSEVRPASTEEIIALLDLRAPGTFQRAVTDIGFGAYRGSESFIVLKVSSFENALGGMLLWEKTMSADLAPFFGEPVTSTFDPRARSARGTREPFFVDEVSRNRDIRVLRDSAEDERIVYTFLDRSTILITTDRDVIEEVSPLIR